MLTPAEARAKYRAGLVVPTSGHAPGFTQANLVVLPRDWAYDMLLFGQRNPQPVPLLDVTDLWRDDLVCFLIGCSVSFEQAVLDAGVPVRNIEQDRNVSMYRTNRMCRPAGRLAGPLVVSMRPIPGALVATAVQVTARMPQVHGAPVHVGSPDSLGVKDLGRPDFGEPVDFEPGDVPVYWACGVTPQAALMDSRPPFAITHAPRAHVRDGRAGQQLSTAVT